MPLYKALIRVVKSKAEHNPDTGYGVVDVLREPVIEAKDKQEVKNILLGKYPQFFPEGKVFEKETKQTNQFFLRSNIPFVRIRSKSY